MVNVKALLKDKKTEKKALVTGTVPKAHAQALKQAGIKPSVLIQAAFEEAYGQLKTK